MIVPQYMKRKLCALFICLIVAAALPERTLAVQDIASFTLVQGEVRIKSGIRAKGKWLRVKKTGVTLFSGDEVRTLAGRAEITFDDGSVVKVAENTSLKIEERPTKRKLFGFIDISFMNRNIKVTFGKLWANIKAARGKWTSFESKVAVAGIKGTSVSMYVDSKGDMQFACHEGVAAIAKMDGSYELGLDEGKEVWIKAKDEDKTLIKSVKGEIVIESKNGVIDLEDKDAVLIGESSEGTSVAAPGANEGVVTVFADTLVAYLDGVDEIVIKVDEIEEGTSVTTVKDNTGPVDLTIGEIKAVLDTGDTLAVTVNNVQGTLTLSIVTGTVDVTKDGQTDQMNEGDTLTDEVDRLDTEAEPELEVRPEPVVEPLPVDPPSSEYVP